jgi:hypothetical protein
VTSYLDQVKKLRNRIRALREELDARHRDQAVALPQRCEALAITAQLGAADEYLSIALVRGAAARDEAYARIAAANAAARRKRPDARAPKAGHPWKHKAVLPRGEWP